MADSLRVLIVDDDEDDVFLAREMLASIEGTRFEVDAVRSADEAAAAFAGPHDVALLDYRLGGRDGIEVLREAVDAGCRFPIILLTGQGDREVDLEAMRAGAADFLAKDRLDANLLERAIRYAIERRRGEDALRKLQAELEDRVRRRTEELSRVNDALRAEVAERARAEEALREADRRKDEFLATLAHELRNPLSPIRGAVDLLAADCDGKDGDEKAGGRAELCEAIRVHVSQLTRLIDDLLDISRITRDKLELKREPIDLRDVIRIAVDAAAGPIREAGHNFETDPLPDPLPIDGDATRLTQVVTNLLTNASKYTPPGGRVRLRVERRGGEALIRVEDSGVGLPPHMLGRIFEPFIQVDSSLTRAGGGLGIGLALVRRLAELHGGAVEAASPGPGQGSVFTVRLPLRKAAAAVDARPAVPRAAGLPPLPSRRVLVVDDMRAATGMLARLLEALGQRVRTANDGDEGYRTFASEPADVVISDISMPGMSGYDLARRIRALPDGRDAVLVALTGFGQDDDRSRAAEAGFDRHLLKPAGLQELHSLLASLPPPAASDG